jgi:uncharacterized protein involved in outer membrane biogenesis
MRRRFAIAAAVVLLLAIGLYVAASMLLGSDAVRTQLERQLSDRFGQPVRIASASASIFPRVGVDLRDVNIGQSAVHLAHLRVTTGLLALISRTVADAEVEAADGRIVLPLPFAVTGTSSSPTASSATALTIQSVRVISLKDVVLAAGARTLVVDLASSLDGDRLDVKSLGLRAEKTRITAKGGVSSLSRMEGKFEAEATFLDLDEMVAIASAMTSDTPGAGAGHRFHLTARMQAPKGQFAGHTFTDLSATVDLLAGRFSLSPVSLRIFGGGVSGTISAITSTNVPRLQVDAKLSGMNMTEVMAASGSPGAVTGTLSGTARVAANGAAAAPIMQTAHGTIAATIENGELPHLDMIRSVVLAFGKPSGAPPQGSGTAFSKLGGTFALAGEVLSSDDLSMAARDLDMDGRGRVALSSGAVDAQANVVLSRELTAQSGTDLRRYAQQDGRVIVPAVIGGTLSQPSVSIDVMAAGRRAIENELQRRAKDFLGGLFKKKKGGG